MSVFIVFAGLPGVGKTTIARELSRRLSAVYLHVDSLEFALSESGVSLEELGPGGYHAAAAIAIDNLANGMRVIADSVNPWPITRELWRNAAKKANARFVGIEIRCTDEKEHRRRVESRIADIEGFVLPTWRDVVKRDYASWNDADIIIDTAGESAPQSVERIICLLEEREANQ